MSHDPGASAPPTNRSPADPRSTSPLQPVRTNDLATIAAGMSVWLVAIGVLYGLKASGAADVAMWWLWLCVAGFVVSFSGLYLIWRRQQRLRR